MHHHHHHLVYYDHYLQTLNIYIYMYICIDRVGSNINSSYTLNLTDNAG